MRHIDVVKDDVSSLLMPTRHNAIDRGTTVSLATSSQLRSLGAYRRRREFVLLYSPGMNSG